MAHPVKLDFTNFDPLAVEKVTRLLAILAHISHDPFLAPRVCLHGGTALNLFILGAPRLSVDIDLNYIASPSRDTLLAERDAVEQAVAIAGRELGFNVVPGKPQHAGRSFRLHYNSSQGPDHVKIDVDYLNRSPLLPPQPMTVSLTTGAEVTFLLNASMELFAGKTKALVERVAVRDLYDVNSINTVFPQVIADGDARLLRRVMLYFLSVSAPFPRPFVVASRFVGRGRDVTDALYPMLRHHDRPVLSDMIATAEAFLRTVSHPADDVEVEYLARAARADFAPELLFADYPDTWAAARTDPAAAWKMQNLTKL